MQRRRQRACTRRSGTRKPEPDLVLVAPQPVLSGLERADHGVTGGRVVLGGVAVGAVVAAADRAALRAAAQVHPPRADREALRAAGNAFATLEVFDRVEVGARG